MKGLNRVRFIVTDAVRSRNFKFQKLIIRTNSCCFDGAMEVQVLFKSIRIAAGVARGLQVQSCGGKDCPMVLGAIAFDYETLHCVGFVFSKLYGSCSESTEEFDEAGAWDACVS